MAMKNDLGRMLSGEGCAACGVQCGSAGRGRLILGTRLLSLCNACSADRPAAARAARARALVAREFAARMADVAEALESTVAEC